MNYLRLWPRWPICCNWWGRRFRDISWWRPALLRPVPASWCPSSEPADSNEKVMNGPIDGHCHWLPSRAGKVWLLELPLVFRTGNTIWKREAPKNQSEAAAARSWHKEGGALVMYLKLVIWNSKWTRRRSLMSWNFSFSSCVTVPTPSGLRAHMEREIEFQSHSQIMAQIEWIRGKWERETSEWLSFGGLFSSKDKTARGLTSTDAADARVSDTQTSTHANRHFDDTTRHIRLLYSMSRGDGTPKGDGGDDKNTPGRSSDVDERTDRPMGGCLPAADRRDQRPPASPLTTERIRTERQLKWTRKWKRRDRIQRKWMKKQPKMFLQRIQWTGRRRRV